MLKSLTGLRFLAALSIVWAHLTIPLHFQLLGGNVDLATTSILGMTLFFVLSGFVIHYNYASLFSEHAFLSATRQFGVARIARIYPLFLAVLLFFVIHDGLYGNVWKTSDHTSLLALSFLSNTFSWFPIWVKGQLLIQHPFGIAWSISTEWFFYVAYIFFARKLAYCTTKMAIKLFVAVVIVAYSFQYLGLLHPQMAERVLLNSPPGSTDWLNSFYRWFFYVSPYSRIFEFLLGAAAAQIVMSRDLLRWPSKQVIAAFIYVCVTLIALMFVAYLYVFQLNPAWSSPDASVWVRFFGHLHMNFGFAPLFAALIMLLAVRDLRGDSEGKWMACSQMIFLGEISYSLYLIHPISIRLVPISMDMPQLWFRLFCGIFLTIALAIGTYTLIEKPGRKWIRNLLDYKRFGNTPVIEAGKS